MWFGAYHWALRSLFFWYLQKRMWPLEFIFQCHIFLPFHTVLRILKARMLKWFVKPFYSGPRFVKLSTMVCLGWPYTAWLTVSLSLTRLWSMWWIWLFFCDFHSVCPLTDENKRFVEASWWEALAMGKTGSCSGGQSNAQYIFNLLRCNLKNGRMILVHL